MPSLEAFSGAVTERVTRQVDPERYERLSARIEGGLTWGVGALVEGDSGDLLWVREDGIWKLPGGGVEDGESRREALVREVREETGIEITVGDLAAVREVTITDGDDEATFYFATYHARPETTTLADDPGLPEEDIERVAWRASVPDGALDADLVRRIRGERSVE